MLDLFGENNCIYPAGAGLEQRAGTFPEGAARRRYVVDQKYPFVAHAWRRLEDAGYVSRPGRFCAGFDLRLVMDGSPQQIPGHRRLQQLCDGPREKRCLVVAAAPFAPGVEGDRDDGIRDEAGYSGIV